jgi:hypothetical protein
VGMVRSRADLDPAILEDEHVVDVLAGAQLR